jgi:hypothetical protein
VKDSLDLDCPDPELDLCSEDQTCCINNFDEMGCCPFKNATCCPGGQCCPAGMKCNLDKMQCEYKNVCKLRCLFKYISCPITNSKTRMFTDFETTFPFSIIICLSVFVINNNRESSNL